MKAVAALRFTLTLVLLFSLGSVSAAPQVRVTIAVVATSPGSFLFVLSSALAQLISRNLPNTTAIAQPIVGALSDRLRPIAERRADLEIAATVTVLDAFLGEETFRGSPVPVRTLTPFWDLYYHLVTVEETGIKAIGDLRGKRVALDPPMPLRDYQRFLRAAGLDPDRDVRMESLGPGGLVAALREKRIDAAFAVASESLPWSSILDLAMTPGVGMRLIPLDGVVARLQKEFGERYIKATIQKGFYPGMTADVPTVGATWFLVTHRDFNADLAYQITRLIFEKRPELAQVHKAAQYITLIGVAGRSPIPFHPGAVRYFKDRGVGGF